MNKNTKLLKALAKMQKDLGKETLKILDDSDDSFKLNSISTGLAGLDHILGNMGIVCGRIYELYGPESSGKTSLALYIIESFQKHNKICAFIDAEHSLDPNYCKKIGIKIDELLISQPDSGEHAFDVIEALINSKEVSLIVVDSVAALTPQGEIDGSISDKKIGLQARLMAKGLRRITANLAKSKCTIIFINQLRSNIVTFMANSEITPGGRALKFYSSVRIEVRRAERIYQGTSIIGHNMKIKIVKNKIAVPFKMTKMKMIYDKGIDKQNDFIATAILKKRIVQKGPFYYYDEKRLAQGKENLIKYLDQNPKITNKIIEDLLNKKA